MTKITSGKSKLLSDTFIRNLKPRDKEITFKDGDGLFLLLHPNGYRYFQLRYSLNGKSRKTQLGAYPDMGLAQAREKAKSIKEDIMKGIDPVIEKRKERAFKLLNAEATFQVVCEKWLHDKAAHVTAKYHQKMSGMMLANCYPRLGKLPINDITTPMILQTLKVMEKRGSLDLMGRVRKHIGEVFDYAKEQGVFFSENPAHVLRRSVSLKKHHKENYQTLRNDTDVGVFLNRLENYKGGEVV
ncbi:MAG: integrase arm-type DNA-binding domain-containing protein, partial [Candidatus Methylopumilus sp.]